MSGLLRDIPAYRNDSEMERIIAQTQLMPGEKLVEARDVLSPHSTELFAPDGPARIIARGPYRLRACRADGGHQVTEITTLYAARTPRFARITVPEGDPSQARFEDALYKRGFLRTVRMQNT